MADTKSKEYTVTGVTFSEASFSFDKSSGKLSGIKEKTANNTFKPVNPTSTAFTTVIASDQALDAYNIAKFKGIKTSHLPSGSEVPKLDQEQLIQKYNKDLKAFNNASFVATTDNYRSGRNIADNQGYIQDKTFQAGFQSKLDDGGYGSGKKTLSVVLAYPLDINPTQDHMKISRYRYLRSDTNLSKPGNRLVKENGVIKNSSQKGDSTLGGQPL